MAVGCGRHRHRRRACGGRGPRRGDPPALEQAEAAAAAASRDERVTAAWELAARLDQVDTGRTAAVDALQRTEADRRDLATEAGALRSRLDELTGRLDRDTTRAAELETTRRCSRRPRTSRWSRVGGSQAVDAPPQSDRCAPTSGQAAVRGAPDLPAGRARRDRRPSRTRCGEERGRGRAAGEARSAGRPPGTPGRDGRTRTDIVDLRLHDVRSSAAVNRRLPRRSPVGSTTCGVADQERLLDDPVEPVGSGRGGGGPSCGRGCRGPSSGSGPSTIWRPTWPCRRRVHPSTCGVDAGRRLAQLESELEIMGPVNPLALEEYQALQERHGFLQGAADDIRGTRRELSKVINSIDEEIVTVFASAFADVAVNFEQLFETLFPGIRSLALTNPDDLLDTGIEISARPSGKNVRKLSLLSGGERTLTALAFLFAVFRSRPSPFYVMDEVEAALDDVNLHRFLSLVEEFRADAQLLLVSHQKRTMEAADCLYGVSMKPGGSSRVVEREGGERAGGGRLIPRHHRQRGCHGVRRHGSSRRRR
ncbi:MAG: AAA family ATPase [Acidimicrobiales bacterium]